MYRLITVLSILACFVPFTLLIWKKLWKEPLYILICAYWLINGLINLGPLFNLPISIRAEDTITLTANALDTPLVLGIFYLATKGAKRTALKITFISFVLFEMIVIAFKGFNYSSSSIIIGVGLIVVLIYGAAGIISYLGRLEHTPQENVMVFIYSSFLFFYGTFIIIYIFSYLTTVSDDADNFFLYYVELFVAALPAIYGLVKYPRQSSSS